MSNIRNIQSAFNEDICALIRHAKAFDDYKKNAKNIQAAEISSICGDFAKPLRRLLIDKDGFFTRLKVNKKLVFCSTSDIDAGLPFPFDKEKFVITQYGYRLVNTTLHTELGFFFSPQYDDRGFDKKDKLSDWLKEMISDNLNREKLVKNFVNTDELHFDESLSSGYYYEFAHTPMSGVKVVQTHEKGKKGIFVQLGVSGHAQQPILFLESSIRQIAHELLRSFQLPDNKNVVEEILTNEVKEMVMNYRI